MLEAPLRACRVNDANRQPESEPATMTRDANYEASPYLDRIVRIADFVDAPRGSMS